MLRTIIGPSRSIADICGYPQRIEGKTYRFSRLCIEAECEEGILLLQTLTGELLLFKDREDVSGSENELIRKWFLVPEPFQEKKHVDELRRIHRLLAPSKDYKDSFTIVTTTDCNARCYYCFENEWKRQSMSEQTARDTAQYILRASKGRPLTLLWFGGEPLYNIPAMDTIVDELVKQGAEFKSDITSNGYFLTKDVAQRAKAQWHLQHAQITIDGTESVYNRRKAYRNACQNPFQRVLDNIGNALDAGISVTIRLNLDSGNAADLMDVLDILAARFSGKNGCQVSIQRLHSFTTNIMEFADEDKAVDAYYSLVEKAKRLGIYRLRGLPIPSFVNKCMADNDSCEVILPDGRIGKCEHFSDSELVGSIYEEKRDLTMLRAWKEERHDIPECGHCPLYPYCINLRKCERTKHGCSEITRKIRIRRIKEEMILKYRQYEEEEVTYT